MFKIAEYTNKTFTAVLEDENGKLIGEFEMMDLSWHRWNEIGFMVQPETAPVIRDKKNREKMVEDTQKQRQFDAEAEVLRNAMRVVESLEGGGGVDWGDDAPETLEEKAKAIMEVSPQVFVGLLTILRNRSIGARASVKDVSAIEAAATFPSVPDKSS